MAVVVALLVLLLSLLLLAAVGMRVFRQLKSLGRTVAASSDRIAAASAELDTYSRDGDGL